MHDPRNRYKEIKEDYSSHQDKFIERRTQDAGFFNPEVTIEQRARRFCFRN